MATTEKITLSIVDDTLGTTGNTTCECTAAGKALIDDANAAAQRTTLGLGSVSNTADADKPVSTAAQTALDAKQATLVSATNIKTINGDSVLGAGDLVVTGEAGEAFPVGSVYIAVVNTNPGTLLGYGTWSAFGAGKMLVGRDAADADFDTAEETGGAKTVTLTGAQSGIAQHTHTQNAHTHTQDAHSHVVTSQTATTGSATSYEHGVLDTSSAEAEATETTATTVATNQNATAVNQNAGPTNAAEAHPNLPPYIVVYMWKRTA